MGKKTVYLLCILFLSGIGSQAPVFGQYMKDNQHDQVPTRKIPENISSKITTNAEKKYPGNPSLQQNTIELQSKAYSKVNDFKAEEVPAQELIMMKRNAAREYPDDYVRQLVSIDKQVKKYLAANQPEETRKKEVKPVAPEK